MKRTETEMSYGIDGGYFDSRFGYDYPGAHELGLGQLSQREVFGKLTETGELESNTITTAWRHGIARRSLNHRASFSNRNAVRTK